MLQIIHVLARVAELVDARDLKSLESNLVPVRLRPWAYEKYFLYHNSNTSRVM